MVDAQRFEEAAEEFERAYGLRPHPMVLYNLGLAQLAARQLVPAAASFEAYLALPNHDKARAQEVRARISELEAKLGYVELDLDPPSATVRIDGRLHSVSGSVALEAGRHSVTVTADGHELTDHEIFVGAGEHKRLSVRLKPSLAQDPSRESVSGVAIVPRRAAFLTFLRPVDVLTTPSSAPRVSNERAGRKEFWARTSLLGAGVALAATTAGLVIDNRSRYAAWQREDEDLQHKRAATPAEADVAQRQSANDARADRIKLQDEIATGTAVAGGLLLAAAVVWWAIDLRFPPPAVSVRSTQGGSLFVGSFL